MSRKSKPQAPSSENPPNGRVIARLGPVMTVQTDDGRALPCVAKGLGKKAVVGDRVHFQEGADTDLADGMVLTIGPRHSELVRADALRRKAQVLAANIDRIYVVCAVEPPLRVGLIDRYLVAAHTQGIPASVIFNKVDLCSDAELLAALEALACYPKLGYPLHLVSAVDGRGLTALAEALSGKTSIFVGHSGVGKTSLLNGLCPGLGEKVQALSESSGRGQHTTSSAALYSLPTGGDLIDSPGVRGFGLWGIEPEEVRKHFVEFLPLEDQCRFADCQHVAEPGCAVKEALDLGQINETRYESYLKLRESLVFDPVGSAQDFFDG